MRQPGLPLKTWFRYWRDCWCLSAHKSRSFIV